jgi:hydroxyacylglutathione hydrolase
MQVHVIVAPLYATNCCVVVTGDGADGADCVIVDAGGGVTDAVAELIAAHNWQVQAVLATHGHFDHIWDAAAMTSRFDVPLRIHADDVYRLADPYETLAGGDPMASAQVRASVAAAGLSTDYAQASNVMPFTAAGDDGEGNLVAGDVELKLIHAPGHTEGSTLYVTDTVSPLGATVVLSGDVLFAGSIGRTDFPGSSPAEMEKSLEMLKVTLDPASGVIPGHGPVTKLARELATNPYLQ